MSHDEKRASALISSLRATASGLGLPGAIPGTVTVHLLIEAAGLIAAMPGEVTSDALNAAARRIGEGAAPDNAELSLLLTTAANLIETFPPTTFGKSEPRLLSDRLAQAIRDTSDLRRPISVGVLDLLVEVGHALAPIDAATRQRVHVLLQLLRANERVPLDKFREVCADAISILLLAEKLQPGESIQVNKAHPEPSGPVVVVDSPAGIALACRSVASDLVHGVPWKPDTVANLLVKAADTIQGEHPAEPVAAPDSLMAELARVAITMDSGCAITWGIRHKASHLLRLARESLAGFVLREREAGKGVAESIEAGVSMDDIGEFLRAMARDESRAGARQTAKRLDGAAAYIEGMETRIWALEDAKITSTDVFLEPLHEVIQAMRALKASMAPTPGVMFSNVGHAIAWLQHLHGRVLVAEKGMNRPDSADFREVGEPEISMSECVGYLLSMASGFPNDSWYDHRHLNAAAAWIMRRIEASKPARILLVDEVDAWPTGAPVRQHITHPDRTDIPPRTVQVQTPDGPVVTLEGWVLGTNGTRSDDAHPGTQVGAGDPPMEPCRESSHTVAEERSLSMSGVKVTRLGHGFLRLRVEGDEDFVQVRLSMNEAHTIGAYMLEPGDERAHVRQVREAQMGGKWEEMAEALYPGLLRHENQRNVIAGMLESINANLVNGDHFMAVVCPSPDDKTDRVRIEEVIAAWSRAGVKAAPEPIADHPCWRKLTEDLAQARVQVMDMERALERMHQVAQPEVKPLPERQGAPIHRVPTFQEGVEACAKALRRLELPVGVSVEHRAALSRHLLETVKPEEKRAASPEDKARTKADALAMAKAMRDLAEEREGSMDEADRQTLLAAAGHLEAAWA